MAQPTSGFRFSSSGTDVSDLFVSMVGTSADQVCVTVSVQVATPVHVYASVSVSVSNADTTGVGACMS